MAESFRIFAIPVLLVAVIAYLLGSISFSIIFTRMFNHVDIRTLGSGNAGMTNVLRSVGVKAAILTMIFDFGKCGVAVCIGRAIIRSVCEGNNYPVYYAQYGAYLAGLACVLGHIYPLYFGFRGGKGILSTSAMVAFIDWRIFVVSVLTFVIVLALTKIVSASSISAAIAFTVSNFVFTYFFDYRLHSSPYGPVPISFVWITTGITLFMAMIIIWKHRANIIRLKNGTEQRLSVKH
ncbi:MAG: glycerol-3-phosphate 1-O-acyltransferase PlsY [Oscillospiraceae bacterium]|jgi:glycerol-3-phosphate acyltransferase PlsY|nr:glycerol-3-phosphate 1-O-acyltransferase PlsY [Oscillospiraceae bacterium]